MVLNPSQNAMIWHTGGVMKTAKALLGARIKELRNAPPYLRYLLSSYLVWLLVSVCGFQIPLLNRFCSVMKGKVKAKSSSLPRCCPYSGLSQNICIILNQL